MLTAKFNSNTVWDSNPDLWSLQWNSVLLEVCMVSEAIAWPWVSYIKNNVHSIIVQITFKDMLHFFICAFLEYNIKGAIFYLLFEGCILTFFYFSSFFFFFKLFERTSKWRKLKTTKKLVHSTVWVGRDTI